MNKILSAMSRTPPIPGKILPESLALQKRFISDSERSPICDAIERIIPRRIARGQGKKQSGHKRAAPVNHKMLKTTAAEQPSKVLLGLTLRK